MATGISTARVKTTKVMSIFDSPECKISREALTENNIIPFKFDFTKC
jgi:hypothetical protein